MATEARKPKRKKVSLRAVGDRNDLTARRDPYFAPLSRGCAIGFRKMTASSEGTWIARWRDPDTAKQHHQPLGSFDHLPPNERYDAAVKAANEWLAHFTQVGKTDVETVADACAAYVKHLRKRRGEAAAIDAEQRFKRLVLTDTRLSNLPLAKLTKAHVKAWRTSVEDAPMQQGGFGDMKLSEATKRKLKRKRSAATINRDLAVLRAAFNLALADGHVASPIAWEGPLAAIENTSRRRDVYLDRAQRASLIEAAPPDLALFIRGMAALPLRPGALAALTVASFDKRLNTLTVGKDKANADRKIKMPPSIVALLTEASKNKLPTAPLFARATGQAWDKNAWVPAFKAAAAAAGLPAHVTMYALRHSSISDLVAAGTDLATVATLSGTSVRMIEQHYAHLQQDVAAAALERLAL